MNNPLNIKNISKSFGDKHVLNNINLSLNEGKILGLIGLNGIGKTTLIKIILNLIKSDEGEVNIFGVSSEETKSRKNISYLPEKFQPSIYLKGREYLSLSMSYFHQKYDNKIAEQMAESLSLDVIALKKRVSSYSKGMGQKLGLLGAFLVDSPLLILDEPMSGLDPKARILLKKQLFKQRDNGKTIFLSSHILADIEEICDNIALLHNGKIIFLGKPVDLITKQKTSSLESAFLKEIS